jgi:phage terminase large subunit-like protein
MTKQPVNKSWEHGGPEWEAMRKRARTDLYWFNAKVLGMEDVLPMTYRAHAAMCKFAERRTGIPQIDNCRVQLIQVARGWGKSALITKGRTLQRLITDRNWAAGLANEKSELAEGFLAQIKTEFETNEQLKWLFPECVPDFKKTTWKSDRIIIQRDKANPVNPSVLATGTGGSVTGVHMSEWIVDDIISQDAAENARTGSFTEIEKANRWILRLPPLLINRNTDPMTFIGTPWWVGDCYDFVVKTFGYGEPEETFKYTLRFPDGETQELLLYKQGDVAIFRMPAFDEGGRPRYPHLIDEDGYEKAMMEDPVFAASQYLLKPGGGGASAFNREWLKNFEWEGTPDNPKARIRYRDAEMHTHVVRPRDLQIIMSVDPAISAKDSAAESAITVCGHNGRDIFLIEDWAERVSPTQLGSQILEFYRQYGGSHIIIEAVAYQESLFDVINLLAKTQGFKGRLPLYEHKTGTQTRKEVRIRSLEPYFRRGMFYCNIDSAWKFLKQYEAFPHIKNKDILDALSFQKELWERLAVRNDSAGGTAIDAWQEAERRKTARIRQHFSRNRY